MNGSIKVQNGSPATTPSLCFPPPPPLVLAPFVTAPGADQIKVMVTGFELDRKEHLEAIVKRLGGKISTNPMDCTHLVVDRIARTLNFMCAFSHVAHIMSSGWLQECDKMKRFVSENSHHMMDLKGEAAFGVNLREAIRMRNARTESDPENRFLFNKFVFYITHSVKPVPSMIMKIVASAGGQAVITKRPTRLQMTKMADAGQTFLVITCEDDLHLCQVFFDRDVRVLSPEFIFSCLLKQEIEYEPYAFKAEDNKYHQYQLKQMLQCSQ
jgi:PAX-interacting protein 1